MPVRSRGGGGELEGGGGQRREARHEGLLMFELFGGRAFVTELGASPGAHRGVGWALLHELACRPGVVSIHLLVRAEAAQQTMARALYAAVGCVAWVGQGAARGPRVADATRHGFAYVRGGRMQYVPEDASGEREIYLVVES